MRHYDYIIAGTGCAGLSLAIQLIESGLSDGKSILLVDKEPKVHNDQTWCFWEKDTSLYEEVVCKLWQYLTFNGSAVSSTSKIAPYVYKMIRADDFYHFAKERIAQSGAFKWQHGYIKNLQSEAGSASLEIDGERVTADYIFSSILTEEPRLTKRHHYFLQHAKYQTILTEADVFDPSTATFMDFRIPQGSSTAYISVWPFTGRKAFIEYTVLSENPLRDKDYTEMLHFYIRQFLEVEHYRIVNEGFETVPRTDYPFPARQQRIVFIGLAGGYGPKSTGYSFPYIQKHVQAVVSALQKGWIFDHAPLKGHQRFLFYDQLILCMLARRLLPGRALFERLFGRNDIKNIFRLFALQTTPAEEWKILWSLRGTALLKALWICLKRKNG